MIASNSDLCKLFTNAKLINFEPNIFNGGSFCYENKKIVYFLRTGVRINEMGTSEELYESIKQHPKLAIYDSCIYLL